MSVCVNKINTYQVMSLLITATFSVVNLLQAAAKVQELCKGLKKLDSKTQGTT